MNKIDDYEWIADFRADVPFPSQARLAAGRARLAAALTGRGHPKKHSHRAADRKFPRWCPIVALAAAAAVAAGTGYALTALTALSAPARGPAHTATGQTTRTGKGLAAGQPTRQATLAAKMLHAAAARMARDAATPEPSPGQWIYYLDVDESANSAPTSEGPEWVTFDGDQSAYYEVDGPFVVHTSSTSVPPPGTNPWVALNTYGVSSETTWDVLAALPAEPHALLAVIARQVATPAGQQFAAASVTSVTSVAGSSAQLTKAQLEFDYLTRILWNARLGGPPSALAAVYRAMATLPGITVRQGITDAAGAPAIGVSDDGGYSQLLLSPVTYQVVGWRWFSDGAGPSGRNGRARMRAGTHWPPKGALITSTAVRKLAEVAAPGDR
jgi:hypothetical protein